MSKARLFSDTKPCGVSRCWNHGSSPLLLEALVPVGTLRANGTMVTTRGETQKVRLPMCPRHRERFAVMWWAARNFTRWAG